MTDLKFQWGPHMSIGEASDELVNILIEKGKEVRKPKFNVSHILAGKLKEEYMYEDWNEWFVPLFHEHIVNYITTLGSGSARHITTNAKSFVTIKDLKNITLHTTTLAICLLLFIQIYHKNYLTKTSLKI